MPRIRASDKHPADGIQRSASPGALPLPEVAWIFAQQRREYAHRKQLVREGIREICAVAFVVTFHTLSISLRRIAQLLDAGLHPRESPREWIEVVQHQGEFLLGFEGNNGLRRIVH